MERWQLFLTSLLGLLMWCTVLASPVWSLGRGEGFRPCLRSLSNKGHLQTLRRNRQSGSGAYGELRKWQA